MILSALLGFGAQIWMRTSFSKYSKVAAKKHTTGKDAALAILREYSLSGSLGEYGYEVVVEHVRGSLTDHYSPKEKILRLSDSTYSSSSIAAIGVAAHECGHAIQDARKFFPNKIRSLLAPVAGIGSRFGPYLAIIGLVVVAAPLGDIFFSLGVFLYIFATLFYLVTLPVEIDASRRALRILSDTGLLEQDEISGVRHVLTAAAMTYVAAAASSILTLLRLLGSRKRR